MATSKQEKNHTTEYKAPRPACEWLDFDTALGGRSYEDDDRASETEDEPVSDRDREGDDWLHDDFHPSTLAELRSIEARKAAKAAGKGGGAKSSKGGGGKGGGKIGSSKGCKGSSRFSTASTADHVADDPWAEYTERGDDEEQVAEEDDDDDGVYRRSLIARTSSRGPSAVAAAAVAEPAAKRARVEEARPALAAQPAHTCSDSSGQGGWLRKESRSQPGLFYYWHQVTGENQFEPPPPWEKRESTSKPGVFYYWNPHTGQTSLEKPEL